MNENQFKEWLDEKIKIWSDEYNNLYEDTSPDDDPNEIEQQGFAWGYLDALQAVKKKIEEEGA